MSARYAFNAELVEQHFGTLQIPYPGFQEWHAGQLALAMEDGWLTERHWKGIVTLLHHAPVKEQRLAAAYLLSRKAAQEGDVAALRELLDAAESRLAAYRELDRLEAAAWKLRLGWKEKDFSDWERRPLPSNLQDRISYLNGSLIRSERYYTKLIEALGDAGSAPAQKTTAAYIYLRGRLLDTLLALLERTQGNGTRSHFKGKVLPPPVFLRDNLIASIGHTRLPEALVPLTRILRDHLALVRKDQGLDYVELLRVVFAMGEILGDSHRMTLPEAGFRWKDKAELASQRDIAYARPDLWLRWDAQGALLELAEAMDGAAGDYDRKVVRDVAEFALAAAGEDWIVDRLERRLRESSGRDTGVLVDALGYTHNPRATPILIGMLDDAKMEEYHYSAVSSLGKIADEAAVARLERLTREPGVLGLYRSWAVHALERAGTAQARAALRGIVINVPSDPPVQREENPDSGKSDAAKALRDEAKAAIERLYRRGS